MARGKQDPCSVLGFPSLTGKPALHWYRDWADIVQQRQLNTFFSSCQAVSTLPEIPGALNLTAVMGSGVGFYLALSLTPGAVPRPLVGDTQGALLRQGCFPSIDFIPIHQHMQPYL